MSKSLAELRQSKSTSLPERSYSLCLAAALVAEMQTLTEELATLPIRKRSVGDDDKQDGPPRRAGEGVDPRAAEIQTRMGELWDEMDEHTGELRLRAIKDGDWRLWVDEHPAREDNKRDAQVTYGLCDADALIDDLGRYAATWNGEDLAPGDWDFIESKASTADKKAMATTVLVMHEQVVDLPKWRAGWLANRTSGND
jgi:hypothetical protein